jgi:hypothetical protein
LTGQRHISSQRQLSVGLFQFFPAPAFRRSGGLPMKPFVLVSIPFIFASGVAFAGSIDGNGALALASLVANRSPEVIAVNRFVLARFLNGHTNVHYPQGKKISVKANSVSCKTSNVDITEHSCELSFGAKKVAMHGRRAHELYATLAEVGVPPDGAAGSIFEALSNLDCVIDPAEVKQKTGGGAHCGYDPAH